MKLARLLVFAVVAAFLPAAALAQTSVIFTNNDGTFTYTNSTEVLELGTSTSGGTAGLLTAISGLSAFGISDAAVGFNPATDTCTPACLGSITLNTGAVATGSITTSATFAMGGNFTVSYANGVTFSGSFSSSSWTKSTTLPNTWTFMGAIMNGTLTIPTASGTMTFNNIDAGTVQLTTVGAAPVNHPNKGTITFKDSGGSTNFSVAPEPGTLALFGSGLILVGVLTRRRLAANPVASRNSV